jgi:hypothetical protein
MGEETVGNAWKMNYLSVKAINLLVIVTHKGRQVKVKVLVSSLINVVISMAIVPMNTGLFVFI